MNEVSSGVIHWNAMLSSYAPVQPVVNQPPQIVANLHLGHQGQMLSMQQQCAANNPQMTLSMERLLESAARTGELRLTGRNLKAFPHYSGKKFPLNDTIYAGQLRNVPFTLYSRCQGHSGWTVFMAHARYKSQLNTIVTLRTNAAPQTIDI